VMDWTSVWTDVVAGFLIAGALAAWVPDSFWRAFFLSDNPTLAAIEGPLVGPLVAMLSFVCSVGNVPLAAVLWRGGISFGGVVSFIFRPPDRPADSGYLPQVLRWPGGCLYPRHLLCDDGGRWLRRGAAVRGARCHSNRAGGLGVH